MQAIVERIPAAISAAALIESETMMAPTTLPASAADSQNTNRATPDLAVLKTKQHAAWSSGDYAVIGSTLQIVAEELCEALDLRAGCKLLDVAAGNGVASLAAARRGAGATSPRRITCEACSSAAASGPKRKG